MDEVALLQQRLRESEQRNEALQNESHRCVQSSLLFAAIMRR